MLAGRSCQKVCVGRDAVFIYVEACCAVLCHVASEHPAVWWWWGGVGLAQADANSYEDVHK